ncbi:MAG: hypothetical protein ACRCZS_16940 [Chroococcidiopsis sp.]
MAGVRVYPVGGFHSFTLGTLTITLDAAAFTYPTSGRTLYERYGYDRKLQVEQFATASYNYAGASHWQAPAYKPPYAFEWNLQGIKESIYYNLLTMQRRQQSGKGFIRFVDYLWPLEEDTPRTRAKKGAALTAYSAGTDLFYPQFDLVNFKIETESPWQQESRNKDSWTVKITAAEADADKPVPITADLV